MRNLLDEKDQIILKMIARTTALQEPSPTIRELCAASKCSMGSMVGRLARLCQLNYLTRNGDKRTARSYCIHPERIALARRQGNAVVRQYYMVN
jgi:DNA-binding IclR family transcriptional regulator